MKIPFLLRTFSVLLFACIGLFVQAQTVLVEAESFQNLGGWVVDQQFVDEMGSPYLLAHGLGTPVADASTRVTLPSAGKYQIWVRTRDWVAPWNVAGAPGKFQISINAQKIDTIFGTKTANWAWQSGGTMEINYPEVEIKLCDLTGFEGRCDAIVLTKNLNFNPPNDAKVLAAWRGNLLGNTVSKNAGKYDLVVIGGGMAGIAASIAAARLGLQVALVQDRPVVGGNNSTEVRVGLGGAIKVAPFVNLGNVIAELTVPTVSGYPAGNGRDSVFNDKIRMSILKAEKNITLFMNYRADGVTVENKMIKSVLAQNNMTAERVELFGTYFSDCTGDGTIGNLAGADFEMNPTAHMGNSNLWNLKKYDTPQPFPRCSWALDLSNKPFPGRPGINGAYKTKGIDALGEWFWESGFSHNPITDSEYIRDYNFRAMYGAWDCLKNTEKIYPNYRLNWAAYVAGKRESRRLLGDVVLTKEDMLGNVMFPDGLVAIGWNMDVHIPNDKYQKSFEGEEFISHDVQTPFKRPFYIPYRCLYSRNIGNLFMAGRNISVTQDALGAVRVMKTTGMMGEVVGLAASLCKTHNVQPRDLYALYLKELIDYVTKGVPAKEQRMDANSSLLPGGENRWKLVWNEEFDQPDSLLDKKWESQNGSNGHILCSRWRENAVVSNGTLKLINHKENRGGQEWTSGNIWTKEQFQYGYYECRYRYAAAEGTNNSFWLMMKGIQPKEGKFFEIDINEGHFPNSVNTNIHNWSDLTEVNGKKVHYSDSKSFYYGVRPDVQVQLEIPVTTRRIRFSSTNENNFNIPEFRIYNVNPAGYPNPLSETADTDVAGLINFSKDPTTKITSSGSLNEGADCQVKNLADGKIGSRWVTQKDGKKWLEFEFSSVRQVGCIQFLNGWADKDNWKGMISNYKVQYEKDGHWVDMAVFDIKYGDYNFARDFHTYGLDWSKEMLVFYFDGKEIRREKNQFCYSPAPVWLSLAIIPWAGKITDTIDKTQMEVDYVRIYKKK